MGFETNELENNNRLQQVIFYKRCWNGKKKKQETQTIWSNNNHTVKYNNFNIFIFNVLCQSSATSVMYHYLLHFRASEKQCSTTSWLARSSGQQNSALLLLVRIRIFHHFINDDDLLGGTGIERYWNHRNLPICTSVKILSCYPESDFWKLMPRNTGMT